MKALCSSTALEVVKVDFGGCINIKKEEVELLSETLALLKSAKVEKLYLDLISTDLLRISFEYIDISKKSFPHLR